MATDKLQANAVIPPGLLIREESEARGMSRRELADALNLSVGDVTDLIAGNAPLTQAIDDELERAFKTPAYIWVGLEAKYRDGLERRGRVMAMAINVPDPAI